MTEDMASRASPAVDGAHPIDSPTSEPSAAGDGDPITTCGNDAMKWAEAFCERYPAVPVDEAVGWFACAMVTMWDVTNSNATHNDEALLDHISALVRNRDMWRDLAETEGEA